MFCATWIWFVFLRETWLLAFFCEREAVFRIFRDAWKGQLLSREGVFRRGMGGPLINLSVPTQGLPFLQLLNAWCVAPNYMLLATTKPTIAYGIKRVNPCWSNGGIGCQLTALSYATLVEPLWSQRHDGAWQIQQKLFRKTTCLRT